MIRNYQVYRYLILFLCLCVSSLAVFSCGSLSGIGGGEASLERLRFINLVNGLSAVNIEVENIAEVEEVAYADATSYFEVNEGDVSIEVESSELVLPILSESATVASGDTATFVFSGSSTSVTSTRITDDATQPLGDDTSIRFMNFSNTDSSVDVYIVFPGEDISGVTPVASALAAQAASSYTTIDSSSVEVVYVSAGTTSVLRRSSEFSLEPGKAYSHVLVPRFENSTSHTSRLYEDLIP